MLERAETFVDERLADTLKVAVPNGAVLAAVNLVSINQVISLLSIGLTIAYTVWRWRRDAKKD